MPAADSASIRFISEYGYLAVLLGTMLEGETVVLLAGFLAHQGYLSIQWIIICAILGSSLSDQGIFFLARFKGKALSARFPSLQQKVAALSAKMQSHPKAQRFFALTFRFYYGLRNISPIVLGFSAIPTLHFVFLNALGAALWATAFSLGGYYAAHTLERVMGRLAHYELAIILCILVAGVCWAVFRHFRKPAAHTRPKDEAP